MKYIEKYDAQFDIFMPVKMIFLEKSESSLERPWSPCITIDTRTWPAGIELLPKNELFHVKESGSFVLF